MCRIGLARKEARAGKHDGLYHRFTLPGPTLTIGIQHRRQRPCCGPSTLDECWFCYHGYSIAIDPHLMLIICNGAMKSGSSWFCHMLLLIAEPEPIPENFQKETWNAPAITEDGLVEFLELVDFRNTHYVSKSHWTADQKISGFMVKDLLDRDDIAIFNNYRDLKDVVVSKYFHDKKLNAIDLDFDAWFTKLGMHFAARIIDYHKGWQKGRRQPHLFHYEDMLADPVRAVLQIAAALHIDIAPERALNIVAEIDQARREGRGTFRKGIVGD